MSATHLANIPPSLLKAYFANRKPFVIYIATLQLKLPRYMRSVIPLNSLILYQIFTPCDTKRLWSETDNATAYFKYPNHKKES